MVLRDGEVVKKKGSAVYKMIGEQLIGGWAEVAFTDGKKPAYVELALSDYSTGKSNWAKMPGVMIEKCAKAGAWRLAYPDEFGGMYTGEEMDQKVERDMHAGTQAVEAESVEPVADLQTVRELFKPFMAATGLGSAGAMAAICAPGLHVGLNARHDGHAGAPRGLVDGGGDRGPQGAFRARRPRAGARARL